MEMKEIRKNIFGGHLYFVLEFFDLHRIQIKEIMLWDRLTKVLKNLFIDSCLWEMFTVQQYTMTAG